MHIRKPRFSTLALGLVSVALLAFTLVLFSATGEAGPHWAANRRLVSELGLGDLCLVTEARYTRHLSVADGHAAFQDHPMALEHFPTGAIFSPPPHLISHAPLDR
ncbi:MAG: hypothetical protein AB7U81_04505 [Thiohalomonadaceae bacterium]